MSVELVIALVSTGAAALAAVAAWSSYQILRWQPEIVADLFATCLGG